MTGMVIGRVISTAAVLASGVAFGDAPSRPTYTRDIAPILNANCVTCHRPGESAPMSLLTYDEVRPWAKAIAKNVGERVMPPWHADKGVGVFVNDRSLSDDEVKTIVKWVDQGGKQGDAKDMPKLPEFPTGEWRTGEPDLVVTFDEVSLPAGGPDQFYDLVHKLDMPADQWLRAVEVKPSNRKVTHHVIVYQTENEERPPNGWLSAWAAGMEPMVFPEKMGRMLKKDGILVGDMHYHPTDEPATDQTKLGLYFAKDADIQKEVINLWVANQGFEIPAGNASYKARSSYTFPQDSIILAVLPHMHYRGKSFTYTAKYPDGRSELLMSTSNYDFNWQTNYTFEKPVEVPKGTRIDCVAEWDNSAGNPRNPDATKNVTFGNASTDEMMIGFVDYIVKDGVRPVNPDQVVMDHLKEFAAKGDAYEVHLNEPGEAEEFAASALYLPKDGTPQWFISLMGSVYEVKLSNLQWAGDTVTGTAAVGGFGTFALEATKDAATGELKGKLSSDAGGDFHMDLLGKPAH